MLRTIYLNGVFLFIVVIFAVVGITSCIELPNGSTTIPNPEATVTLENRDTELSNGSITAPVPEATVILGNDYRIIDITKDLSDDPMSPSVLTSTIDIIINNNILTSTFVLLPTKNLPDELKEKINPSFSVSDTLVVVPTVQFVNPHLPSFTKIPRLANLLIPMSQTFTPAELDNITTKTIGSLTPTEPISMSQTDIFLLRIASGSETFSKAKFIFSVVDSTKQIEVLLDRKVFPDDTSLHDCSPHCPVFWGICLPGCH